MFHIDLNRARHANVLLSEYCPNIKDSASRAGSPAFNDKSHFLRTAALVMRQVLVNYARASLAAKRGGDATHVPLEFADSAALTGIRVESDETLIAVHEALGRLTELSPRLSQVVECRFFAGYSEQETAEALGMNERTVRRDWAKARAWLRKELGIG